MMRIRPLALMISPPEVWWVFARGLQVSSYSLMLASDMETPSAMVPLLFSWGARSDWSGSSAMW